MTPREQAAALLAEARKLGASALLLAMTHIIFQINGFEAALACLREGAAQKI